MLKHIFPLIAHNRITEITFFATTLCNFRCKHCYLLDKLNKKHDELTVEELKKIGRYIPTLQRVHIAGGEPFMRNDISEVIKVIANEWNSEVICLPTNGVFKDKIVNTVNDFISNCDKKLRLHFSINTLEDDFDEFTSSNGTFLKWKDTINSVKEITFGIPNITLLALMTFNDYNQDYFEDLIQFVKEDIGVDDVSIGLVRSHKDYQPKLDIEKFNKIVNENYRDADSQNVVLRSYRELIRKKFAQYHNNKEKLTKCYSGRVRVVFSPEGDVYPCETLGFPEGDNMESYCLGNIREFDYNINKLLKSKKSIEILNNIKMKNCDCQQGIDLSLSLLCSNLFKFQVIWNSLSIMCQGQRKKDK